MHKTKAPKIFRGFVVWGAPIFCIILDTGSITQFDETLYRTQFPVQIHTKEYKVVCNLPYTTPYTEMSSMM